MVCGRAKYKIQPETLGTIHVPKLLDWRRRNGVVFPPSTYRNEGW